MPNVEAEIEEVKPGVTVERAPGYAPRRVDKRGVLEMLRDEINEKLGTDGKARRKYGLQEQTLDEVVDEAVKGAPKPGVNNEY